MKWLQYSRYDLEKGLGGVEVHARSLQRELRILGIEAVLSSNPADLKKKWDVVHTHGSSALPRRVTGAVHVHTFHGTTLGRMNACGEWTWPGGYLAYSRELWALFLCDVALMVHPGLHFASVGKLIGRHVETCWNGWNNWDGENQVLEESVFPTLESIRRIDSYFVFNAREDDPVKNADFIRQVFGQFTEAKLIRVPADTGALSSNQVRSLLLGSKGLVLASHYEGLPLVVLEALALSIPVLTTGVGGLRFLSRDLQGLKIEELDIQQWKQHLKTLLETPKPAPGVNLPYLPTWNAVAKTALKAVREFQKKSDTLRLK